MKNINGMTFQKKTIHSYEDEQKVGTRIMTVPVFSVFVCLYLPDDVTPSCSRSRSSHPKKNGNSESC